MVPAVVVVMVAHDPGRWFEEALASVAAQDYPNASLLVIDSGSGVDLEVRIAGGGPGRPPAPSRGRTSGSARRPTRCSTRSRARRSTCFCHDDVRLEPDVIQVLVEEAYRSNAGIDRAEARRSGTTPTACSRSAWAPTRPARPARYVERGELDQEQHDAVRDVFYVPGACHARPGRPVPGARRVRPRHRAARRGPRPVLAGPRRRRPRARRARPPGSRHLEALGDRRPIDDRRRLQMRHRLRTSRVCYTLDQPAAGHPAGAVIAARSSWSTACSSVGSARRPTSPTRWLWNARRHGEIRSRRKELAAPPGRPRPRRAPAAGAGSARLSAFLRGQIGVGRGSARLGHRCRARPGHQPPVVQRPLVARRLDAGARAPAGRQPPLLTDGSRPSATSPPSRRTRRPCCTSG